ncbi:hypothetical protein HanIR_Chr17g0871961 [Helianthus annuus]|nr:hypothetical protein HanIR_Chr17g0871961 [Helianthus annuus]
MTRKRIKTLCVNSLDLPKRFFHQRMNEEVLTLTLILLLNHHLSLTNQFRNSWVDLISTLYTQKRCRKQTFFLENNTYPFKQAIKR